MARVMLVDDHEVVRRGLRSLLDHEDDLDIVSDVGTGAEALRRIAHEPPDVVVLDVRLPDADGVELCRTLRERFPDVRVLILTSFADEILFVEAQAAGAHGFLLKRARSDELIDAVRSLLAGDLVFDRPNGSQRRAGRTSAIEQLSPQERAVARHIAQGLTNRSIAEAMGLSEKTVKNYVSHVLMKLEAVNRAQVAVRFADAEVSRRVAQSWDEAVVDRSSAERA